VNGCIGPLHEPLVTTSNYNSTASIHTLKVTAANTKCSPACSVFTSRLLAMASNSGDLSASRAHLITLFLISLKVKVKVKSELL
jgi:hypothetical protein